MERGGKKVWNWKQAVSILAGMFLMVLVLAIPQHEAQAATLNGVAKASNGNWYYYVENEVNTSYNGLNSDEETTEMTFSKTTGEKEFVEQAFSLGKGELSEVIETENGYYILYCKEPYDEAKTVEYKENVLLEREKEAFQKAYKGWKDQYKTVVSETLMDQISFD